MPNLLSTIFDAFRAASAREVMPTTLDTAGLRAMGSGILNRAVFCAHGTNAIYLAKLDEVIKAIASGSMDEATARVTLLETLRSLGYTPEGGFPDAPAGAVPPALRGTLQDLSSFRRLDLIVQTQRQLMQGAGQQLRGLESARLLAFPAWELTPSTAAEPRIDWDSRLLIAGFPADTSILLKGDPRWGELGSYENFQDALGVDHPPFFFRSTRRWREVSLARAIALGVRGPDGQSIKEFHGGIERPRVMAGSLPLPTPQISLAKVPPALVDRFQQATGATVSPTGQATLGSDRAARRAARLQRDLDRSATAYQAAGERRAASRTERGEE